MSESVVSHSVMYLQGPGDLESITHNAITYVRVPNSIVKTFYVSFLYNYSGLVNTKQNKNTGCVVCCGLHDNTSGACRTLLHDYLT